MRRSLRAQVCLVAALLVSGCAPIHELTRSFIFQPGAVSARRATLPEGAERWTRALEGGGEVEAYYFPPGAGPRPAPAVLFAHGNAESIDDWVGRLDGYHERGLAVLLVEYRGYGRSGGQASEATVLDDFAHYYDELVSRPEVDGARVVMHGRSLGGGVATVLSSRRPAAALVLESTFTNTPDVASRYFAPMGAFGDRFDSRAVLERSSTPTLVMHGVDDTQIPFAHAVELHRVAWDSRLVAFHAGHDDLPRGPAYWDAIEAVLRDASVLRDSLLAED